MTEKIVDVQSIAYGTYSALVGLTRDSKIVIAQPTVEILMGWEANGGRKKIVSKSLKDFAGIDYKVGKSTHVTPGIGQGKTTFYDYSDFLVLLKWQLTQANLNAINITVAGFADSFSDFAYTAFGIAQTEKERQDGLVDRILGKDKRIIFTDEVRDYIIRHSMPSTYQKNIYAICTDTLYLGIFNRTAAKLKADWDTKNPRDKMTPEELRWVASVEGLAGRLILLEDREPLKAVKEALNRMMIPVQTR
jgi:hypothetical protein